MGAVADVYYVSPSETGGAVSTTQSDWTAAGDDDTIVVQGASGINNNANVDLNFAQLYAGDTTLGATTADALYVNQFDGTGAFTIVTDNKVSIGTLLTVLNGDSLALKSTGDSNTYDFTVGTTAGTGSVSVDVDSSLALNNVDDFTVMGAIENDGDLTVNANTVVMGALDANGGDSNIAATAGVVLGGITATNGADVTVAANGSTTSVVDGTELAGGIISAGAIQNTGAGMVQLNSSGAVIVAGAGNIENQGAGTLIIAGADGTGPAGDVSVEGAITNSGTMELSANSLTVKGGTAAAGSIVNNGNLTVNVTNAANVGYGINLAGMDEDETFDFTAGTLVFADGTTDNMKQALFSNRLANYDLTLTSGQIQGVNIVNGQNGDNLNAAANMSVTAGGFAVNGITNMGAILDVVAKTTDPDAVADITVSGQVLGAQGSVTNLTAQDTLTVNGVVSNTGAMTLSGENVNLSNVSNLMGTNGQAGTLNVWASTENGAVSVSGDVTNSGGVIDIKAKDVSVSGTVVNEDGMLTLVASDNASGPVSLGAIDVQGGNVNLNALAGKVAVTKTGDSLQVAGGVLNVGANVSEFTSVGNVLISGDLVAGDTFANNAGDVNILSGSANPVFDMSASNITIGKTGVDGVVTGGDILIEGTQNVKEIMLSAQNIEAKGNVSVAGDNMLTMSSVNAVKVGGDMTIAETAVVTVDAPQLLLGSLSNSGSLIVDGTNAIIAQTGDVSVGGNLYFDTTTGGNGLVVTGTNSFSMSTTNINGRSISFGGASIAADKTLTLNATGDIGFSDEVNNAGFATMYANNANFVALDNSGTTIVNVKAGIGATGLVDNSGTLSLIGQGATLADIENSGDFNIKSNAGTVSVGNLTNSASFVVTDTKTFAAQDITNAAGTMNVSASEGVSADGFMVSGYGANVVLNTALVDVAGAISVAGDVVQGANGGMLNTVAANLYAGALDITNGGNLKFVAGAAEYNIRQTDANLDLLPYLNVAGKISVAQSAMAVINAGNVVAAGVENSGVLTIDALSGMSLGNVVNNLALTLDANDAWIDLDALTVNAGNVSLYGTGVRGANAIETDFALIQDTASGVQNGINVRENSFEIDTQNLIVGEVSQNVGSMTVQTGNLDVGGSIFAQDLRFVAPSIDEWMTVEVGENISGGVGFLGVGRMDVGGNYTFDSGSVLGAIIMKEGVSLNNYWSTVSLNNDNTLGQITNAADGQALINVGGVFKGGSDSIDSVSADGTEIQKSQIGITLQDAVNPGTAIWLLHAQGGVENADRLELLRNLDVRYCNADGSLCYDYLTSLDNKNSTDGDLPAYVSVRDNDADGRTDSLYIVFDPRFGGPVLVDSMKLQPIVARLPEHTDGEYISAGALDNLIAGQLLDAKYYNRTPIEAIPLAFQGTVMSNMADELYNRIEYYVETTDGQPLAQFSRLFQAYETEQIAGIMSLNEHTVFRSFEDRMLDEFIWNRNRNLRKAWLDVDYGMSYHDLRDGVRADGNRFSVSGGFDWQDSETMILGLSGHISRTSSKAADSMDLGYAGNALSGHNHVDVTDTNVGLGGYMMKTLGEKTRLYGNAFLDLHMFDINREQNFVTPIDGSGTAFSLISEWGLMHDILNQYIVGNIYARVGYNFGFDVTEEVTGGDYMHLESDGYFILTPGYSLTAQKRIYPSAWFQIRPYASIGVEYDVVGGPDSARYKFDAAKHYTSYDLDIDPLWANIGGGIEFLSALGLQFGIDYRYQYNSDIQLHNIRVSGSYRF